MRACVCVCVCARARVRACVCVCARVRACVCVCECLCESVCRLCCLFAQSTHGLEGHRSSRTLAICAWTAAGKTTGPKQPSKRRRREVRRRGRQAVFAEPAITGNRMKNNNLIAYCAAGKGSGVRATRARARTHTHTHMHAHTCTHARTHIPVSYTHLTLPTRSLV